MTTPQPVNGNQYYKIVQTLAEQIPKGTISELHSMNATVSGVLDAPHQRRGAWDYTTVVGYVPTPFTAIASYTFLVQPAQSPATVISDTRILVLPPTAQIVSVELDNNGTPITSGGLATIAIGSGTVLNTSATAILTATAFDDVSTGWISGNAGAEIGGAGGPTSVINVGSVQSILVATVATAVLTAGDLRATVVYRVPVV